MKIYQELLENILRNGQQRDDRTGVGTLSIFGHQMRFNLAQGFPLITTKKVHFRSIVHELLWFLKGDTNLSYLHQNNISIWNEWANSEGDLGPIYGKQWRSWDNPDGTKTDQIAQVIQDIQKNPHSRRLVVTAWNVSDVPKMALAPCHCLFQFYVQNGHLSCQLYQRSADVFLGLPFNIASYALLTHLIAHVTGLKVGELIHTLGDTHLYLNHIDAAQEQLRREPFALPMIKINPLKKDLFDIEYSDIELLNYQSHPPIFAPIAV